ncbi:hypothetical protein KBY58_04250 [Cyanobium sp. HWJ4-Hawea]|uniref:hypothetical protein n=1 Tax=Cyanobium sp. HWJ4-Hawea TaxID=2823713 RepID=UPI0020CC85DE|nr:hypothetical protein [Cyanobium sp. HWJ4-Hawea]MCP9808643.1 hypothetical protein [Cyanobium sp. HWJ4-Hawea]
MVWLLREVEAICGQAQPNPTQIRGLALAASHFLEHSPGDFLEPLLASPFGRIYGLLLERGCNQDLPDPDGAIAQQRDQLSQKLRVSGFQGPEGHGLLLALMPLYPPLKLKVEDAPAKLPGWLLELYRRRYEPATAPGSPGQDSAPPTGQPAFDDRIFLNRMLGLSNLYYIDPEDQEILQELRQVRLQTLDLLLGASREQLGRQFSADFGDRFWAMAQSGVQKEPLDAHEVAQRDAIQTWLSTTPNSLHQEGGIQRFAAALLFNVPGSVSLANPEQNLPAWFVEGFRRYTSMALGA